MNIIQASMKYRLVTLMVTLMLISVGIYSLMNMPRREDPKMTIREGLIIIPFPGAKATHVEEQVTKTVEVFLSRYNEVDKEETESTTSDGLMIIKVTLQDWVKDRDKFWSKLRHDLYELKHLKLPPGTVGPIINSDFGDTIALLISVESDRHTYTELKDYIEIIEDEIKPLEEVSKLKRFGLQKEQIYVTTDSQKTSQYGVSLPQVIHALQSMNSITYSGEIKTESMEHPIHTTDLYDSEQQIGQQQVYVAPSGGIVRLKDVADVERRYEEPESFIRVNGKKVLMLSVEMQEGYNIVEFGEKVDKRLKIAEKRIPPDVNVKKIIDQPTVVNTDIQDFMKELLVAIVAVVLVTLILLPLRIAAVAAITIPITILITFAFLDFFKIDLQQMTLAGLITVLGMVVDNAIVIVDEYVNHLDHEMSPWEAGVKSATGLFVPIFSATIAIIFAFIPINFILTGNAGEFLLTLPLTVTISLVISLFIAVLVTPTLCYIFIKTGLKSKFSANTKKRSGFLDLTQKIYDVVLEKAFKKPAVTLLVGILAIAGTVGLMSRLDIRMFPLIERNQFCLEIYMNQGTKLEETDRAVKKLEEILLQDKRVDDVTSFVGTSSPRFYLTYAPQSPDKNYAQILINTISTETAMEMIDEYIIRFKDFFPNGEVLVKQLQQGPPVDAPVEVRIVGNDMVAIKKIGEEVKHILKNTPGTNYVRSNFREDYYGVTVQVDPEVANRLGFSSRDIARVLGASFKGAPISTLWEGDNPIDILLRLEEDKRKDFEDINNIYVTSPVTGGRIPLRQIAKLVPEWQTGKIRHRNGIRTLTIQSESQMGRMPNEILNDIRPKVAALELPPGITIQYGGELAEQVSTMGEQTASLIVSLILILLVLLFQFKEFKRILIIVVTIPLSWFGAILGLYITNNPFSCTAFLGVISLCGIVVRNGIILVEYADQLREEDRERDVRSIAIDAGKRRMRPVFLTTMSSAVGVVPMIISGSPLWAPMGSVLSVGLVFGMVLTLFIVPVLYWLLMKPGKVRVAEEKIPSLNAVELKG